MAKTDKMYRIRISHESHKLLQEYNAPRTMAPPLEQDEKTVLLEVDSDVYKALCLKGKSPDEIIQTAIAAALKQENPRNQKAHTPRPWRVNTAGGMTYVENFYGQSICRVTTSPQDADLIAAAPDLLALLEELQWNHTQKWPSDDTYHHVCPHCENTPGEGHKADCQIGSTIAKAKGGA